MSIRGKKYIGVYPTSEATKDRQLDFQAPLRGKMVQYYHCWIDDPEHGPTPLPFKENEEPVKSKVRAVDFIVRFMWVLVLLGAVFYFFTPENHGEPEEIVIHE